ncbi:MAG: sulfatase [Planctomycetales bacterium]|nr:sulfatase [Planctomycetales bacterium]
MQIKLKHFGILLVALWMSTQAFAADRPNFVWLISEDNSIHYLKLFDEHGVETPRIAELAKDGLVFNNAFSNAPVCSVARTTLITGCYAPRIGTQFHRRSVLVPLPGKLKMFPTYLRDAGYYTTNKQKKDYNAIENNGVWDESSRKASWRNRKDGQPFFHKQSFATSHESSLHFSRQSMEQDKTKTDPASVFVAPYHPNTPTFRYTYARYHDRIQEVDQQIGSVVDQLEADGLLDDTFIFYFGDHGGVLPRGKGYAYESGLHVPLVVRIPKNWKHLVDFKRGDRVNGFVSFVDFGPTLLELAGIDLPTEVDGRPFLGTRVTSAEVNSRDEAFGHADRFDEKYDLVRTLRKGKYEYVRNYQPYNFDGLHNNYRYKMLAYQELRSLYQSGELNEIQRRFFEARPGEALYDIESDPHETRNLATDPAYAEVLSDLRSRLTNRVKSLPDLSMYPESVLVDEAFSNPVGFGQDKKSQIAKLVDIADLSLIPFDQAARKLDEALSSSNPWERYWALIACTVHGTQASPLAKRIREIVEHDDTPLVRVRAAEYLAMHQNYQPQKTILDALANTNSGVEAGLILNSLVLLRDGKPGYDFSISLNHFKPAVRENDTVKRRMEYLDR